MEEQAEEIVAAGIAPEAAEIHRLRMEIAFAIAKRDQLNLRIEVMIEELCRKLRDRPLSDRLQEGK